MHTSLTRFPLPRIRMCAYCNYCTYAFCLSLPLFHARSYEMTLVWAPQVGKYEYNVWHVVCDTTTTNCWMSSTPRTLNGLLRQTSMGCRYCVIHFGMRSNSTLYSLSRHSRTKGIACVPDVSMISSLRSFCHVPNHNSNQVRMFHWFIDPSVKCVGV